MMKLAPLLVLAGCARAQQPQSVSSFAAHVHAAQLHEARASEHAEAAVIAERAGPSYDCGDSVLQDQTTSGGQRVEFFGSPCADTNQTTADYARFEESQDVKAAQRQRKIAAKLLETEVHACEGIPERERYSSPFADKRAIERIEPIDAGSAVRGVRIIMKPEPGLTAPALQRDIQCHLAHYATLGQPDDYLPEDPTIVPGASIMVTEQGDRLEVEVVTPSNSSAQLALQRARGLVTPVAAR